MMEALRTSGTSVYFYTCLYDAMSQEAVIFILAAVRTWNGTKYELSLRDSASGSTECYATRIHTIWKVGNPSSILNAALETKLIDLRMEYKDTQVQLLKWVFLSRLSVYSVAVPA
jgi:hypothetical protein